MTNDDLLQWLQEIIDGHSAPHDRGVTRLATECKAEIERLERELKVKTGACEFHRNRANQLLAERTAAEPYERLMDFMVQCRCGWKGAVSQLTIGPPAADGKFCPACGRQFVQLPAVESGGGQ